MDSIRNIKQQYDSLVSAIEEADEYWIEQDKRKPHELMEKETQDTLLQALKTFSFAAHALEEATKHALPEKLPKLKRGFEDVRNLTDNVLRLGGRDQDRGLLPDIWEREYERDFPPIHLPGRWKPSTKIDTQRPERMKARQPQTTSNAKPEITTASVAHRRLLEAIQQIWEAKDEEIERLQKVNDDLTKYVYSTQDERLQLQYTIETCKPLLAIGIQARLAFRELSHTLDPTNDEEYKLQMLRARKVMYDALKHFRHGNFMADLSLFKLNIVNPADEMEKAWIENVYGSKLGVGHGWLMSFSKRQAAVLNLSATLKTLHNQGLVDHPQLVQSRDLTLKILDTLVDAYTISIKRGADAAIQNSIGKELSAYNQKDSREYVVQRLLAAVNYDRAKENDAQYAQYLSNSKATVESYAIEDFLKLLAGIGKISKPTPIGDVLTTLDSEL